MSGENGRSVEGAKDNRAGGKYKGRDTAFNLFIMSSRLR